MSSLELSDFLQTELLSNPLLEEQKNNQPNDTPQENNDTPKDPSLLGETPLVNTTTQENLLDLPEHAFDETSNHTENLQDYQNDSPSFDDFNLSSLSKPSSKNTKNFDSDEGPDINLIPDSPSDFRYHILQQFRLLSTQNLHLIIAEHLIDLINDAGWLSHCTLEIAESLGCTHEQVLHVLSLLQTCEPSGIFARDLKECLLIQLKDQNLLNPTFLILLDNLEDIANGNVKKLEKKTGKPLETIKQHVQIIRQLDPKPATLFTQSVADTVIPDIIVFKDSRNRWQVSLNEYSIPKLNVRRNFYSHLKKNVYSQKDKQFISENYQNASWLIKSVEQRNKTMLQVAEHIVKHQQLFFDRGISAIKPMILKEISERTALHESTISRITTNKFMSTPWGTFEMKYFFNVSLDSLNGASNHAATFVKHSIQQMIQQEPPQAILSDDKLMNTLREQGINIARRTITKYREAMNIPSSVVRRRQKNPQI
jgi:RNA polymerase sigma-54 factor